mmetsp:Transcript_22725/g.48270  ORF Transcript_22725/g.48270 Transcript_22725/m.48270 type:complete len:241 (-) Transcript_22725:1960-2682(-)
MLQNDRREVVGRWHVAHHRVEEVGVEVLLHDRLGDLTLGVAARERVRRPLKVVEQRRRLVRTLLRDEDGLPDGVHSVKHVLHGRGERRGAGEDNARVEGRVARPSREDKREENFRPRRRGDDESAWGVLQLRQQVGHLHRPDVHVLHKLRVHVLLAEEHLRVELLCDFSHRELMDALVVRQQRGGVDPEVVQRLTHRALRSLKVLRRQSGDDRARQPHGGRRVPRLDPRQLRLQRVAGDL